MLAYLEEPKRRVTSPPLLALPNFDEPFVLEHPKFSWERFSLIKTKKEVQPEQYATRTMTKTEKIYSTCEKEALAVIFDSL